MTSGRTVLRQRPCLWRAKRGPRGLRLRTISRACLRRAKSPRCSGFANKLPEHAARIAAVLQVYDDPDAEELALDYLMRGIEIAQFYASEAIRLHSASRVAVNIKDAERLRLWIMERWTEPYVTVRVI